MTQVRRLKLVPFAPQEVVDRYQWLCDERQRLYDMIEALDQQVDDTISGYELYSLFDHVKFVSVATGTREAMRDLMLIELRSRYGDDFEYGHSQGWSKLSPRYGQDQQVDFSLVCVWQTSGE